VGRGEEQARLENFEKLTMEIAESEHVLRLTGAGGLRGQFGQSTYRRLDSQVDNLLDSQVDSEVDEQAVLCNRRMVSDVLVDRASVQ
jgi:hypothetical protein